MRKLTAVVRVAIAAAAMIATCAPAHSQTVFDLEYQPKRGGYESTIGIGLYKINDENIGFYGNLATTLADREPQYDSFSLGSFGDPVVRRFRDVTIFNVGITKRLGTIVAAYAGIGYASAEGKAEKFDPMRILADDGSYYVNDPSRDKSGGNFNAGLLLSLGAFSMNVGYNSFTKAAVIGVGTSF